MIVIGISWASFAPRGSSNLRIFNSISYSEHVGSFADVGSANFAAPFRVKGHPFVGSVSYTRAFDIFQSAEWNRTFERILEFDISGIFIFDTSNVTHDGYETFQGGLNVINFAFGTRMYDKLSAGLSVNIYSGNYLHVQNELFIVENDWYFFQHGTGVLDSTMTDTSKFSGMNLTLGMKYAGEKTFAGLIIKTPFALNVNADTLMYRLAYMNDVPLDDRTDTVYYMDNVTKYDMPWIVGAGFAYKVNENWLVAADAEMRAFKGGKIQYRDQITINPGGDNIETYIEYDPRWENVFTVRLGTEYLRQTGFGVVPIRAGLGYCPLPEPNYDNEGKSSQAVEYRASLGTGIHWSQIHFDVAYSVSTVDLHYYGIYDATNRNHHLNVSFTGVF